MNRLPFFFALCVSVAVAVPAPLFGQGVQTGILTGTVQDTDGLPVPGANVMVTSPALQGERTAVTDAIGVYIIRGLPPGQYKVKVELAGMQPFDSEAGVPLGGTARLDATLKVATLQELVQVTAEATPPPLVTTQTSVNYRTEVVSALPIDRRPAWVAELAPGLTDNTPNTGQLTISGAFAYDNIFLIDGVDTDDNLFGSSHNLYIEDAIEETQVLTSGISAEYGRFSGGVVNIITKKGGDAFHGSLRQNFTNTAWTDETPFEVAAGTKRTDKLSKWFEGSIGGPIVKSRLWFFNADRFENSDTADALREVGTTFVTTTKNKRAEIKFTGTPFVNQTVSVSYLNNATTQDHRPGLANQAMDPAVLVVGRKSPNRLWVANWNGALSPKLFGTFQASRKLFGFRNTGGTSLDIRDSPFRSRGTTPGIPNGRHYNAPFFSSLDPEDRNNRQFTGSLSYYFTSADLGRHDVKGGFEDFTSTRTGGNSQSSTDYVFLTDYQLGPDGKPVLDSKQHPVPVWQGNAAAPTAAPTRIQNWIPTKGAQIDIRTMSFYLQDHWTVNNNIGVDLGVRYERIRSEATGDIVGVDTDTVVPRLGINFDPKGDGSTTFQATYAEYAGKYSEAQFARNTAVGSPSRVDLGYIGPSGVGLDFAPGYNLNNYVVIGGNFPLANVFFDDGLSSPTTREISLVAGHQLRRGGYVKAVYTHRRVRGFIDDFIDNPTATGKTTVIRNGVNFGTFDNVYWRNTDVPGRRYQALQFQSRYRVLDRLNVEGHWTIQLQNNGDFEGEAANQPGNPTDFGDYPEILRADRNFPDGRLDDFQRHKVRIFGVYNLDMGRFGTLDLAPIVRINSAQTFSLRTQQVALSAVQLARNPGYARLPGSGTETLYYDDRGSQTFKGYGVVDFAFTYGIPIWKAVRPWLQVQIFNALNNQKLFQWDTTVAPDPNSPRDENGLPTGYIKGTNFGKATSGSHFPLWISGENGGRTVRMSLGIRF